MIQSAIAICALLALFSGCATTSYQGNNEKSGGVPEVDFYTPKAKPATSATPTQQPRTGGQAPNLDEYKAWKSQSAPEKSDKPSSSDSGAKGLGLHQVQPQQAPYNPGKAGSNPGHNVATVAAPAQSPHRQDLDTGLANRVSALEKTVAAHESRLTRLERYVRQLDKAEESGELVYGTDFVFTVYGFEAGTVMSEKIKAQLTATAKKTAEFIKRAREEGRTVKIHIDGFADPSGNRQRNQAYSEGRGKSGAEYFNQALATYGEQVEITYAGKGVASDRFDDAKNRRLEIHLTYQ